MQVFATTWPWSASAGTFLVAYAIICFVLIGVGVLGAMLLGDILDGPTRTIDMSSSTSASWGQTSELTSVGIGTLADTLLVGRLPRADELLLVASLGGRARVEATLAVLATQAGWLRADAPPGEQVLVDVDAGSALMTSVKSTLDDKAAGATLAARLRTASFRVLPELQRHAVALGLARPAERRSVLIAFGLASALVTIGFGAIRLWVSPATSEALVILEYAFFLQGGLAVLLTMVMTARHKQARLYLRWLDGAIDAIRDDVRAGDGSAADTALVAAVDGYAGLGAQGRRLGLPLSGT